MRHVLATRRTVPLDRLEDYREAWERVLAAAAAHGVNAWLFRGAGRQDSFMEFLEWDGSEAVGWPAEDVAAACALLDEEFTGAHSDSWEEMQW